MNHYDDQGKKTGRSHRGFWGNTNHYDDRGNKVGESFPSFWGGADHYGFDDDHDAIQDELDSFDDPEEAMAWLEDEGYDPDDFDF